jgi:hypothetical protein
MGRAIPQRPHSNVIDPPIISDAAPIAVRAFSKECEFISGRRAAPFA